METTLQRSSTEGLTDDNLRLLYRLMLTTRTFDSQAVKLQRQGRISFFVPCEGEEAAEVGSAYALRPEDWLFPDYRSSGVLVTRGMPLELMFAQLMATSQDLLKGRSMPSHWGSKSLNVVPPSSPLCTQLPHAVGVGLGAQLKGDQVATIAYFGDGGTSSSDFHSGLNFAGLFKTPTVFFCRNNRYAISVPVAKQTAVESLATKASAYGVEGVQVDGNDVLAVYSATMKALEKARRGDGPTMIEAMTYRLGPHSTSDDPSRYRDAQEEELMRRKNDPLTRFRSFLESRGIWSEQTEAIARESILNDIKKAISVAERFGPPHIKDLFEDVYKEKTWNLVRQADELMREVKGGTQ
jgi:pyruvate dehydrogenase E1 component alpha subunit